MPKCKKCSLSSWSKRDFNAEGICVMCITSSQNERIPIEVFAAGGELSSLRADGATLILTELKVEGIGKVTVIPIASIQEFSLTNPAFRSYGQILIETGNNPFSLFPVSSFCLTLWSEGERKYAQNIQKYISDFQANASTPAATPQVSVADELVKLKALVDQGILTQEEFEHKKKLLLGM